MRGKRLPPHEPVDARLRASKERRNYLAPSVTAVIVNCSRCGQGLPDLLLIPDWAFSQSIESLPFLLSRSARSEDYLYIEPEEQYGWRRDGPTLRPTPYQLERQARAQEAVRTQPRTETKRHRQRLADRSRKVSEDFFSRPLSPRGDPFRRRGDLPRGAGTRVYPAPEVIECPRCGAIVRVAAPLAAHSAVE